MTSVLDPPSVRDWDRQRDEPVDAWFAFKRWRDTNCTMVALAEDVDRSPSTIAKWSSDWSWKHRKLEFDRFVSAGDAQAAKLTSETMAAAHLTAAALLREGGLKALRRLLDQLEADPTAIGAQAAVRAVVEGTKIERLTFGQATEITQGPDYSKLTDEQFDALRKLQELADGSDPST